MELVSDRLRLRPITPADADGPYLDWVNDPVVTRYLSSEATWTADALRAYVSDMVAHDDTWFLAMELASGRHIGNIKLGPLDTPHRRAAIGILVGERECWGQGYASEAIRVLTEWAFAELGLHKVTAGAWDTNRGSVGAFEKAGFHVEAVCREHFLGDDGWADLVLLARFAVPDTDAAADAG